MANTDDKGQKEEELKIIGPGADELGETVEVQDDEDDERGQAKGQDLDDDEEKGDDERVGHGEEDRESIRARRREERKQRKEQRNRERLELRFLRDRNDQLERRFSQIETRQTQNEVLNIDSRISTLQSQIAEAERVHAQAVDEKNGEAATEALRIRDALRDDLRTLGAIKQQRANGAPARRATTVDPEIVRRGRQWMNDNADWFDPQLRDEDSTIAKAIEDALFREGRYDARTDAYWREYGKRLQKRLPHLFKDERHSGDNDDEDADDDEDDEDDDRGNRRQRPVRKPARGGPRVTTGGRERPLKPNEVYVSPERVEAMKEAGVWDDPVLRQKYLKKYREYDTEHGRRR